MRCKQRQRGFVLLMAVAMIPLFGFAVLLTTAQTGQLARRLKHMERQAEKKTLLLSAEAWVEVNRDKVKALGAGESIAVPISDVVSCPAVCTIAGIAGEEGAILWTLTLNIEQPNRAIEITKEIGE